MRLRILLESFDLNSNEYKGVAILITRYQFLQEKIASGCVSKPRPNLIL